MKNHVRLATAVQNTLHQLGHVLPENALFITLLLKSKTMINKKWSGYSTRVGLHSVKLAMASSSIGLD